jgi:hypothetical protein
MLIGTQTNSCVSATPAIQLSDISVSAKEFNTAISVIDALTDQTHSSTSVFVNAMLATL